MKGELSTEQLAAYVLGEYIKGIYWTDIYELISSMYPDEKLDGSLFKFRGELTDAVEAVLRDSNVTIDLKNDSV